VARAEGVIFRPDGHEEQTYACGIGKATNNRAEALALYIGLRQLQHLGVNNGIVFGDSALIIKLMQDYKQNQGEKTNKLL